MVRRALDRLGVPCRFAPAPDAEAGPVPAARRTPDATTSTAGRGESGGAVELATFHRSKGLEWQAVHVVGLESGFVPIVHASTPDAVAEERRLLYVALTRAARVLECSWARRRTMGGGRPMERDPSPWVEALAGACAPGGDRAGPPDAARRFADLRANLKG